MLKMEILKSNIVLSLLTVTIIINSANSQRCNSLSPQCSSASNNFAVLQVNNTLPHFYIGGLFGVHSTGSSLYSCGTIRERGFQNLEAFLWAVSTFKQRYPNMLQGTEIGALAFDTCQSPEKAMQQILNFENCEVGYGNPLIDPDSLLAYVGPDSSDQGTVIAPGLTSMQKTVVSHAATSSSLSKSDFFLRTVPSDSNQVIGMVELLNNQGIKYVQVIYTSDTFGLSAFNMFQQLANNQSICIINSVEVSTTTYTAAKLDEKVLTLNNFPETKLVVMFANNVMSSEILKAAKRMYSDNPFTWIGTNSWGTSASVVNNVEAIAAGALTFSLDGSYTKNLTDFQNYFRNILSGQSSSANPWFEEYNSSRSANSAVEFDTYVPYTLQAVDAVLMGIDEAIKSRCFGAICSSFNQIGKWSLIFEKISTVQAPNVVEFDSTYGDQLLGRYLVNRFTSSNANGIATYDYENIGSYYQNQLTLQSNLGLTSQCGTTPCVACGEVASTTTTTTTQSPFPMGNTNPTTPPAMELNPPQEFRDGDWVIVLLVLAALGILLVVAFEVYLTYKMSGKSFVRSMWLGQALLLAIFLSFLCLFAFIPSPTKATCGIIRFGVGICYAMIFSVFLVKLMIIFSSKTVGYLKGIFQLLMFIFAWGVQIAIDVEWLIMRPPEAVPVIDNVTGLATSWQCSQSFTTHVTTLSYVMFLIVVCAFLSFKAHGIVTNHREVIYIGICSFLSILIFWAWILLGILQPNKDFEDPCLAFGLFIVAIIVLLTMYLPKIKQLNSIEKKDVYIADDDTPQYTTPSIIPASLQAPSLIFNNGTLEKPNHVSQPVIYVDDVDADIYSVPNETKTHRLHVDANPDALYLKHPGSLNRLGQPVMRNNSLRSGSYSVRSVPVDTTRVLKRTADLSGRTPIVIEERAQSEAVLPAVSRGYAASEIVTPAGNPRGYGTARSVISARSVKSNGTLGRTRSLHDVGSL